MYQIDPAITKINEEALTLDQTDQFWNLATKLSSNYVHNNPYVCSAVNSLYFPGQRKVPLEEARQCLINLVQATEPQYQGNCFAIVTYLSDKLTSLGIAHNILAFNTIDAEGKSNTHAVIVYRCEDLILVCDIPHDHLYQKYDPSAQHPFLLVDFDDYPEILEQMTSTHTRPLFDKNARLYEPGLTAQISLPEWSLSEFGFFTKEKHTTIQNALGHSGKLT